MLTAWLGEREVGEKRERFRLRGKDAQGRRFARYELESSERPKLNHGVPAKGEHMAVMPVSRGGPRRYDLP